MKIQIRKIDGKGYAVYRQIQGEWKLWLDNQTYDAREGSYYADYYRSVDQAKAAAIKAKEKEAERVIEMEI